MADTDADDLYTPRADSTIWRKDDDEENESDGDNEDDEIRLGIDNLFPFRRHGHR